MPAWLAPLGAVLYGAAALVKTVCPPHTVAAHIADMVLSFGVMHAVTSPGVKKKDD
jgi:hypothetical protein